MRTILALVSYAATSLLAAAPLAAKPNGSPVPPGAHSVLSCKSTAVVSAGIGGRNVAIAGWASVVTQKYGYGWATFANAKDIAFGTVTRQGIPPNPNAHPPFLGTPTIIQTTVSAIPCNHILVSSGNP